MDFTARRLLAYAYAIRVIAQVCRRATGSFNVSAVSLTLCEFLLGYQILVSWMMQRSCPMGLTF